METPNRASLTMYDSGGDEVHSCGVLVAVVVLDSPVLFLPAVLNLPSNPIIISPILIIKQRNCCYWPAAVSGEIRILWCRTWRFPFINPDTVRQADRQTLGGRGNLRCVRAPLTVWLHLMYLPTGQQWLTNTPSYCTWGPWLICCWNTHRNHDLYYSPGHFSDVHGKLFWYFFFVRKPYFNMLYFLNCVL